MVSLSTSKVGFANFISFLALLKSLNQLRTVIRNNSTTGTVRQLAKTLRNEIAKLFS
jgi:hypothetical protein